MRSTFVAIAALFLLFQACKRDNRIGFELIQDDQIGSHADTVFDLRVWPLSTDTIRTDNTGYATFGRVSDPIFGTTSAEMALQFNLSGAVPFKVVDSVLASGSTTKYEYFYHAFGRNPKVDSMFVHLAYDTASNTRSTTLGNSAAAQALELRLLKENLPDTSFNFSSMQALLSSHTLASLSHNYLPANEYLAIKIDNQQFLDTFLNRNTTAFNTALTFRNEKLKGFALLNVGNTASFINRFDLTNTATRLRVYYQNDSTRKKDTVVYYDFRVDASSSRLTTMTRYYSSLVHDYSSAAFVNELNKPDAQSQRIYIQSLGGVRSVIDLPGVRNWAKANQVMVRAAQLILKPVNETRDDLFPELPRLSLYRLDQNRQMQALAEYYDYANSTYLAEAYDAIDSEFRFDITSYVNRLIANPSDTDMGLILVPESRFFHFGRNVLHSHTATNKQYKMFVRIVYSQGN